MTGLLVGAGLAGDVDGELELALATAAADGVRSGTDGGGAELAVEHAAIDATPRIPSVITSARRRKPITIGPSSPGRPDAASAHIVLR
jgi:hypothetical protein